MQPAQSLCCPGKTNTHCFLAGCPGAELFAETPPRGRDLSQDRLRPPGRRCKAWRTCPGRFHRGLRTAWPRHPPARQRAAANRAAASARLRGSICLRLSKMAGVPADRTGMSSRYWGVHQPTANIGAQRAGVKFTGGARVSATAKSYAGPRRALAVLLFQPRANGVPRGPQSLPIPYANPLCPLRLTGTCDEDDAAGQSRG